MTADHAKARAVSSAPAAVRRASTLASVDTTGRINGIDAIDDIDVIDGMAEDSGIDRIEGIESTDAAGGEQ